MTDLNIMDEAFSKSRTTKVSAEANYVSRPNGEQF
jgi:hypothetical protein